jgi:hypothetical protein
MPAPSAPRRVPPADPRESDGKFSFGLAGRNLLRGVKLLFSGVVDTFRKHPVRSGVILGAMIGSSALFPPMAAALGLVGTGIGVLQIILGGWDVGRALVQRDPDRAERAFVDLGAGLANVGLTVAMGQAAQMVGHSGAISSLGVIDNMVPIASATNMCEERWGNSSRGEPPADPDPSGRPPSGS